VGAKVAERIVRELRDKIGGAKQLNEAATARYFGQLSGESPETGTRWRSEVNSNCQYRFVKSQTTALG
jgi:hypothetical protein